MRLFDSTILIAHLRGDERATTLLVDSVPSGAFASVVSRTEVEGGVRSGERADVARLFGGLEMVPVTDAVARLAGRWLRDRRSHEGVELADHLVAATAEHRGAELVTLDVRHPVFPELRAPWADR